MFKKRGERMINAPYEKEFVFHDGRRAKNLLELSSMLETIEQQDFERFVNPNKNDFANWVEYVLLDKELASSLRSTILLSKTRDIINNKIKIENNSGLLLNEASDVKKSFFKILRSEKKDPDVEVRKSVAKLPQPEHHEAGMLSAPEKKRWFRRKEKITDLKKLNAVYDKEIKEVNKELDKDNSNNPLRKWYQFNMHQFNKRKHIDKDPKDVKDSVSNGGNILWILLYCILIVAIIAIIAYKFVL